MSRMLLPRGQIFCPRGFRKPARFLLDQFHPINRGLVGYWPFGDQPNGGFFVYRDATQFGYHASVSSGTVISAGHHGGAAATLASSQFINALYNTLYDAIPGTWCTWIKTNTLNGGYPCIMSRNLSATSGAIMVLDGSTAALRVATAAGGSYVLNISGGASLIDNAWHFVAFVFDQNGKTSTAYVDGVSVATGSASSSWAFPTGTSGDCGWGQSPHSTFAGFTGSISDARMYNRALTPTEIKTLYMEPYVGVADYESSLIGGAAAPPSNARSSVLLVC